MYTDNVPSVLSSSWRKLACNHTRERVSFSSVSPSSASKQNKYTPRVSRESSLKSLRHSLLKPKQTDLAGTKMLKIHARSRHQPKKPSNLSVLSNAMSHDSSAAGSPLRLPRKYKKTTIKPSTFLKDELDCLQNQIFEECYESRILIPTEKEKTREQLKNVKRKLYQSQCEIVNLKRLVKKMISDMKQCFQKCFLELQFGYEEKIGELMAVIERMRPKSSVRIPEDQSSIPSGTFLASDSQGQKLDEEFNICFKHPKLERVSSLASNSLKLKQLEFFRPSIKMEFPKAKIVQSLQNEKIFTKRKNKTDDECFTRMFRALTNIREQLNSTSPISQDHRNPLQQLLKNFQTLKSPKKHQKHSILPRGRKKCLKENIGGSFMFKNAPRC